ncbi:MAG: hypothetical protein QXW10_01675 [Candidatus Micrarchaeaceae archaeon]
MQAWLECNDLLIRAKNALFDEALDIFNGELESGSIAIDGKFIKFEEPNMQSREVFLMLNMLNRKDELVKFFSNALKRPSNDAALKTSRFLGSINSIERLVALSKVFDDWAEEALLMVKEKSAYDIIEKGMRGSSARKSAVEELLRTQKGRSGSSFSAREKGIFAKALASTAKS